MENNQENGIRYYLTLLNNKSISEKILYGIDLTDDNIVIEKLSCKDSNIPAFIKLKRKKDIVCNIGKMYCDNEQNLVQVIETSVEIIFLYKASSDIPASKVLIFNKIK